MVLKSNNHQVKDDDVIDLTKIFYELVKGKKIIFITTLVAVLLGSIIGQVMTPTYQSVITIAASNQDQQSGGSGLLQQLGGVASSFGISGLGQSNNTEVAMAIYKSKPFTERLFSDDKLVSLMFPERWDDDKKKWLDNVPPGSDSINARYRKMLRIVNDTNTKTKLIFMTHENPILAAEVANKSIVELNNFIRETTINESIESQAYLTETLALTNLVDVKNVIYSLIEEQIKTSMLANVRKEFVFKVIDYASISSSPVKPNKTFIIFFTSILGFLASSLYVYLLVIYKESNEPI